MKPFFRIPFIFLILAMLLWKCTEKPEQSEKSSQSEFSIFESHDQIHILAGGEHFTSYLYGDEILKPVLYPVYSSSGIRVQREYPLKVVEGESHDHEHHVGIFFTYGSDGEVNGSSFWNRNDPPPRISHQEVISKETRGHQATLETRSNWVGKNNETVLVEDRTMIFSKGEAQRAIDFTFNLKALDEDVEFEETKEGMFAIRVADWLSEEHGNGTYLNAESEITEENVWGKRSKWMRLEGEHEGTMVGVAILNHPTSVNYPTYWHARGYGLFSANPLGQSIFQEGRGVENPEPLDFSIPAGENSIFKFKMIIYEGHRSAEDIETTFQEYSS